MNLKKNVTENRTIGYLQFILNSSHRFLVMMELFMKVCKQ